MLMNGIEIEEQKEVPSKAHPQKGRFVKQNEQYLYRYTSSRCYFAIFRHQGKLIKRSLETTDKDLAKRRLGEFQKSLSKIELEQHKMRLSELVQMYLESIQGLDQKTIHDRTLMVKIFLKTWPQGSEQFVKDVKKAQIQLWLAKLSELRGREISKSTKNEYLRIVRQMFNLAVDQKIIPDSPAEKIKQFKREKPIRLTPTWEEFQRIVNNIREQRFNAEAEESADFVEFLGLSGLGNSEAAALKWGDIDWKREKIRIYRNKTDRGFEIPIFPQLKPLLEKLKQKNEDANPLIFQMKSGKKSIAAACTRLKLPHYSHRSFRRMFITQAIERSIPFHVVASWQGHSDGGRLIATTYGHLRTEYADEMAKKMIQMA